MLRSGTWPAKAFHEDRGQVKNYAESNQLDLKKEADLRKLVGHTTIHNDTW